MNDNEKIMSDLSYTNKDFNSIYSELLDTAKKLTNKWDPSLSNESDPGVLLLKLNALVADKNNYNIDKNVLECFPLSVTQQSNARKLYDLLGYNMHWYRSAKTLITFSVLPGLDITDDKDRQVDIPLWTTLANKDNTITYVTLKDVDFYISKDTNSIYSESISAIEGTKHEFDVNGETNLTVENLDENLRLYFNETQVAENGIFITTQDWVDINEWERVDNLALYPEGRKIYKFGVLPNSDTCYIEFPSDVANLIANTFKVNYIVSSGVDGNTKANTILYFLNDTTINIDSELLLKDIIKIDQTKSGDGGKDIETLDDAYVNYKRSIGTFNTLVTTQDYTSFIYNMESTVDPYLVSNVIVSDRTNDLNYSNHIISWDGNVNQKELIISKKGNSLALMPFDLLLYLYNYTNPITVQNYEKGFLQVKDVDSTIKDLTLNEIRENISEIKSLQHNINSADLNNLFSLNNLYLLKGQVTTYYKVTSNEKSDIETNIQKALLNKYSSRNIEFGTQPDYNELIETIKNADARINSVVLNPPEYAVKKQINSELSYLNIENKVDLIARMVLSGNVQLFKFDDDFLYDFGQKDGNIISSDSGISDISSITTETTIALKPSYTIADPQPKSSADMTKGIAYYIWDKVTGSFQVTDTYSSTQTYYVISSYKSETLSENELLQFVAPNYISTKQYSVNVKYTIKGTVDIRANEDFILTGDQTITFEYTDSTGLPQKTPPYGAGTMINSTFDINGTDISGKINTNQSIYIKEENSKEIKYGQQYIAILNSPQTLEGFGTYILQENEYFIYTDLLATNLVILGSGTAIKNLGSKELLLATPENLNTDYLYDTSRNNWWTSVDDPGIKLTELLIYSLSAGGHIESDVAIGNNTINNTYKEIKLTGDKKVTLVSADDEYKKYLTALPNGENWQVRSRLNINSTTYSPQQLTKNQTFKLTFTNNDSYTVSGGDNKYLMFNYPIQLAGGVNIDTSVITPTSKDYLRLYTYTKDTNWKFTRENNLINIKGSNIPSAGLSLSFSFNSNYRYIIPIQISSESGTLTINDIEYANGISYVDFKNITTLSITKDTNFVDGDSINIGYINKVIGYNANEINVKNAYNEADNFDINDYFIANPQPIAETFKANTYYIKNDDGTYTLAESFVNGTTYYVSNGMAIENKISNIIDNSLLYDGSKAPNIDLTYRVKAEDKVLQPTLSTSYFNLNHIYNRYTIAQIDTAKYNITVNPYYVS